MPGQPRRARASLDGVALALVAVTPLGVAAVSARLSGSPVTPAMLFVAFGVLVGPEVLDGIDVSSSSAIVRALAEAHARARAVRRCLARRPRGTAPGGRRAGSASVCRPAAHDRPGRRRGARRLLGELTLAEQRRSWRSVLAPTDAALGQAVVHRAARAAADPPGAERRERPQRRHLRQLISPTTPLRISSAPTRCKSPHREHVGMSAHPDLRSLYRARCPIRSDHEAGERNLEQPEHHEVEPDHEQHRHGRRILQLVDLIQTRQVRRAREGRATCRRGMSSEPIPCSVPAATSVGPYRALPPSAPVALPHACLTPGPDDAGRRPTRLHPSPMSTAGLSVFSVVLVVLESDSEKTITSPSVMLVTYAPSRYPSISFDGLGSRSIRVVAALVGVIRCC